MGSDDDSLWFEAQHAGGLPAVGDRLEVNGYRDEGSQPAWTREGEVRSVVPDPDRPGKVLVRVDWTEPTE
jgi:hypothetical protein